MHPRTVFRVGAVAAILTMLAGLLAAPSLAAPPAKGAAWPPTAGPGVWPSTV